MKIDVSLTVANPAAALAVAFLGAVWLTNRHARWLYWQDKNGLVNNAPESRDSPKSVWTW